MSHPQPPYAPVPQRQRRYAPLAVVAVIAVVAAAATLVVVLASGGNKPSTSGAGTAPFGALRATETTTTTTTTTTTRPPYVPRPEDFELEVQVLEQHCFGSAGCNVTFQIGVAYNGDTIYDGEGPYTVVYSVTGTDDPFVGRFTLLSQYEFQATEEFVSTPLGSKLTATVTEVF